MNTGKTHSKISQKQQHPPMHFLITSSHVKCIYETLLYCIYTNVSVCLRILLQFNSTLVIHYTRKLGNFRAEKFS